jgi:hypothetical protein
MAGLVPAIHDFKRLKALYVTPPLYAAVKWPRSVPAFVSLFFL